MEAIIKGNVQPKGRPRFSRTGEYVRTYTPKRTKDSEDYIRWEYVRQTGQKEPMQGAIIVEIGCYYEPPKSASKKARQSMIEGGTLRTVKPDIDNLAKTVLDALNGTAWVDDKQIIDLRVTKAYSTDDFTFIRVKEVGR